MKDATQLLRQIEFGHAGAADELFPLVYDELRRLAQSKMKHERPDHTLSATGLVHEAYVRLIDADEAKQWSSRAQFFAAAAESMRRILIDSARRKNSQKRGGGSDRVPIIECDHQFTDDFEGLLETNELLEQLETDHPRPALVLKMRIFSGFTLTEIAEMLGISRSQTKVDWAFGRRWMARRIRLAK